MPGWRRLAAPGTQPHSVPNRGRRYNVDVHSRAGIVLLALLRIAAGLLLTLMAVPMLIQGGFSRYAEYGMPAHPDWRYVALGFVLLGAGSFLVRPYWWRSVGTRRR